MPRKLSEGRKIHTLVRVGGKSVGVIIPITFIRELKWHIKKKVLVRKVGKRIVIQNPSKKDRQQKLF